MTQFYRKAACNIIRQTYPKFDRQAESDQASAGGFRPEPIAGQLLYSEPELVALDDQQRLKAEGYSVRLAGDRATRLYRGIVANPEAERLLLVTLDNGNRFAANADEFDLASGFSSGSMIREAIVIDVRNLRVRIARMIEDAAAVVGEPDNGE
jgi:hypothetical protein